MTTGNDFIKRSESLAEKLAQYLRDDIAAGKYKIGERLPTEQQMASTYGVSRPIVREAIGRLKHDGLVMSRQGSGAFVVETHSPTVFRLEVLNFSDKADIRNIIELLIAIEAAASEQAARRRSDEQLERIRQCLDAMQAAIDRDEGGVEEDLAFHRAIVEAGGNPFFRDLSDFFDTNVRRFIRTARANSARQAGFTEAVQDEHRQIFNAIRDKDPAAARAAAETHLFNAAERLAIYIRPD